MLDISIKVPWLVICLQSLHRHVQQSMCFVTYFVQEYVDLDMSQSMKESFMDIWILTSTVIEKDHIKHIA